MPATILNIAIIEARLKQYIQDNGAFGWDYGTGVRIKPKIGAINIFYESPGAHHSTRVPAKVGRGFACERCFAADRDKLQMPTKLPLPLCLEIGVNRGITHIGHLDIYIYFWGIYFKGCLS